MPKFIPIIPIIYCDNQSAKCLADNPLHHIRSKHIYIKYHFIRQKVEKESLKIKYIPTEEMKADILTKVLHGPRIVALRNKIGLTI